jgi:replicative DNA helicase
MKKRDVERAVIGSILVDSTPESTGMFRTKIKSEYFDDNLFRRAYEACLSLSENGVSPTLQNLATSCGFNDQEMVVLAEACSKGEVADAHLLAYRLVEEVLREKLRAVGRKIGASAEPFDGIKLLEESLGEMLEIIASVKSKSKLEMHEEYSTYLLTNAKGGIRRIPTGVVTLDRMLNGGFADGDMTLLGGLPGAGKTSFALALALTAAKKGFKVAFLEGEMTGIELYERLNAIETGTEITSIRNGKDYSSLSEAFIARFFELPFEIVVVPDRTPDSILRLVTQHANKGCKLIVVDYLQVFAGEGQQAQDEFYRIKRISERLRGLALKLHVHILVLSSLNRNETTSKKLTLNSFYGSSGLGHDCHVGLLLSARQNDGDEMRTGRRDVTLSVVKNRSGIRGDINLVYELRCQRMSEARTNPLSPSDSGAF